MLTFLHMGMVVRILASSSRGNCALLKTDQVTVLVDAGLSCRQIKKLLEEAGESLESLHAVFVTHEHGDHVKGLTGLSTKRPGLKVFTNRGTCEAVRRKIKGTLDWQLFETGCSFRFKDLEISTFSVPHDGYDPVGFVFNSGGEDLFNPPRSIAWLTDLGYVPSHIPNHVKDADVLILEANHDIGMLENSGRPWSTKQRIRGRHGHLSNEAALDFLRSIQNPRWRRVFLAHLSNECNCTKLVREHFGPCLDGTGSCPIEIIDPSAPVSLEFDLVSLEMPTAAPQFELDRAG